jgi:Family of unknown function (DUF6011)
MRITSKYNARCANCGGFISVGQQCDWERGEGVRHIGSCPAHDDGSDTSPYAPNYTPTPEQHRPKVTVTMGVFRKDDHIYVVKPNREKTRVYAKEIVESPPRMTEAGEVVDFEAVYRPGVIYSLTEADRWDLADAADFLTKYAKCIVCNRSLRAAKSVAGAIGPVCAKYFAGGNGQ